MKKSLFLLSLIIGSQLSAFTIKFVNKTPYLVEANIMYGSKKMGACGSSAHKIKPMDQITPPLTHDTGCCIKYIKFTRVDAGAPKPPIVDEFYPEVTEADQACRSFAVIIEANPDGSLYTYSY